MLKNFILNLKVVKEKITELERECYTEKKRIAEIYKKDFEKQSGQYSLSDKEKIDRINRLEVQNKKLNALNDGLLIANENLESEVSMMKEEKKNLFPSNRTRKLFTLKHAHEKQLQVNKNLKTEIQSLKERILA